MNSHPRCLKTRPTLPSALCALSLLALLPPVQGLTIHQGTGAAFVAFEGESTDTVVAGTPESWGTTNDVAASGGAALYAGGSNSTGDSPHSFAQYRIRFRMAGTYRLYSRWKADAARTGGDVFTANSSWFPLAFGSTTTPGDQAPYYTSASNGAVAPADNTFAWVEETAAEYTVSPADAEGGVLLVFTVGTREAGMLIDRWVFHPTTGLTQAQLDPLVNSDTDVVVQDVAQAHVAFEAEEPRGTVIAGTPESWVTTNDVAASSGAALYAGGSNSTGDSPHSFAQYRIRFRTAGTYRLYSRWKADAARTGGDVFTANSSWFPLVFGSSTTPGDQAPYYTSASNGAVAPADNTFAWVEETAAEYPVSQADAEGGVPLVFTVGTREAGMVIDRWVFHPTTGLTGAQLDALGNSGVPAQQPEVTQAVGSASLTAVTVHFSRPVAAGSVAPARFVLAPVLAVSSTTVDADDARRVHLVTATQAAGTAYQITINGVTDADGIAVAPDTRVGFTAWKLASGWALKEVFYNITGTTVQELKDAPKYLANQPDVVQWVRGFQLNQAPLIDNYGARLTALFTPDQSGIHEFYVTVDDAAELALSSDISEANLLPLAEFPLTAPPFSINAVAGSPAALSGGTPYLLQGLLKQGGGDVYLNVAAAPQGTVTAPETLRVLDGVRLSAWVNPDLGAVTFLESPQNVSATVGSRARFAVKIQTSESPVYYQWRVNGAPIPEATRSAYITPVLTAADTGKSYDVVVSVAGRDTTSTAALLTVGPGTPSNLDPFIGVNFVGGGIGGIASPLAATEVAGVVRQEHWSNLAGTAFQDVALADATGAATPVTLTITPKEAQTLEVWYSGTSGAGDADGALLHGFLSAVSSLDPVDLEFRNLPPGTYRVIVYSVGFDFSAVYDQAYAVTGGGTYPTYHTKAETGLAYISTPAYRRMSSTNPAARTVGNYVQFDEVSPAADGSLTLSVTWESAETGNTHQPALNAVQLVRVSPVTEAPTLGAARTAGGIILSWPVNASGYTLELSPTVGAGAVWTGFAGVANPLAGAGSVEISASGTATYFRLRE